MVRLRNLLLLEKQRLPNIKNESLVLCLTGSIRRSRIEVPNVDYEKLSGDRVGESSESIRARVQAARDIQRNWFSNRGSDIVCNANVRMGEIRQFCKLPEDGQRLMRAAMTQLNLSARVYHRILKLARTVVDLAGSEEIRSVHLAEALHASQSAEINDGLSG
jgi:predicted ATPase with chaperone activity